MTKRVLDVGNCVFDHKAIRSLIEGDFDAEVVRARGRNEALAELQNSEFDLVLLNRQLEGGGDGIELIKELKSTPRLANLPTMLITNFAEYQQAAVAAGAAPGFGKRELGAEQTLEKLKKFLPQRSQDG